MFDYETSSEPQNTSICEQYATDNYLSQPLLIKQQASMFNQDEVTTFKLKSTQISCFAYFQQLHYQQLLAQNLKLRSISELGTDVQFVDLSFNSLKNLNFRSISLLQLNVSHNAIKQIDLADFPNLKILAASNNQIEKVYGKNENLSWLNLSNNIISEFSDKYLTNLANLNIEENLLKNVNLERKYDFLNISSNPLTFVKSISAKTLLVNNTKIQFWNFSGFKDVEYLETDFNYPIMFVEIFPLLSYFNGNFVHNIKHIQNMQKYVKFVQQVFTIVERVGSLPLKIDIGTRSVQFADSRSRECDLMLKVMN